MAEHSPGVDGYCREPIAEAAIGSAIVYICRGGSAVIISQHESAWIGWPPAHEDVVRLLMARDVVLREAGQILQMRLEAQTPRP